MTLTCPSCGNSQNFLVKTLQMHVVHLEDSRVEVSEESRPAVFEVLCDECEKELNFADFEERTGIDVQYEGITDYETVLTVRVDGGDAPDLAQVAQPGPELGEDSFEIHA